LQARALRRIIKALGPSWRVFLTYLVSDHTNWELADLWSMPVYRIRLFRQVLTFEARELVGDLAALRAGVPLTFIKKESPAIQETKR
jgi:hypothetical protein